MIIKNNRLCFEDGNTVDYIASPNFSGTVTPLYLIMHYTAGTSFDGAVEWLTQKRAKASAHFVIGRDGQLAQLVSLNRKSWHAGKSCWGELISMNRYSIGIELVNAGKLQKRADGAWVNWANNIIPEGEVVSLTHRNESKETGWQVYPEKQMETALSVASALHEKYGFLDILGHDDVAPTRKVDPGPAFPMVSFSSIVLGRNEG